MKLYIADAFTRRIFGGNPAGVVILPKGASYPPEETMRKTAAELRYSETAFILPCDDSCFQLRYFTPAGEVDLCVLCMSAGCRSCKGQLPVHGKNSCRKPDHPGAAGLCYDGNGSALSSQYHPGT